jgi:probable rRNA maturation factor
VDSASPEPSPRPGTVPATGTAAQDPAASAQPPRNATAAPESGPPAADVAAASDRVTVVDEQDAAIDAVRLLALAEPVLTALKVPAELELSVTCVDAAAITALNIEHLGSTGPTDVLAFPIDAPEDVTPGVPGLLGDVVLCPAVAHAQAADHDRSPEGEVDLLLVHGILHLLGHDHAEAAERRLMFGLTDDLLAAFGGTIGPAR